MDSAGRESAQRFVFGPSAVRKLLLRPHLGILFAEIVLAAALGFLMLGNKSFWLDEGFSVSIAGRGWAQLWSSVSQGEANMGLYYLLLHFWLGLGMSEAMVRGLSVLFAVASVPAAYALGARLFGIRAGLTFALLLPVNIFFLHYGQEARGYSLLVFMSIVSTYLFVICVTRPTVACRGGYAVVGALVVYAHFFGALVLASHVLSLAFLRWRDTDGRGLFAAWAITAVLLAPLVVYLATTSGGNLDWVRPPAPGDVLRLFQLLAGDGGLPLLVAYSGAGSLALLLGIWSMARSGRSFAGWRYGLVVALLLFPVGFAYLVSFVKPVFVLRFLIVSLPPFVLLASAGLSRIPYRWLFVVGVAVLVALSGRGAYAWYADHEKEDWRAATSFVLSEARPGDAVAFFAYFVNPPFDYYVDRLGAPAGLLDYVDLASEPYRPGTSQPTPVLDDIRTRYDRVWLVLSHDGNQLLGRNIVRDEIQRSLRSEYPRERTQSFRGVTVQLYERASLIRYQNVDAPAFLAWGEALSESGKYEQAVQVYNRAIRLDPRLADAYIGRGIAYRALGRPDRAIKDYDEAIGLSPRLAGAYFNRGVAQQELGDLQQAIQDFDATIRLDPQNADAYLSRGNAYLKLRDFQRALEDYGAASIMYSTFDPRHAVALASRAIAFTHLGEDAKSSEAFGRAVLLGYDRALLRRAIDEIKSKR